MILPSEYVLCELYRQAYESSSVSYPYGHRHRLHSQGYAATDGSFASDKKLYILHFSII